MRNGNIAFGNIQGSIILFEPSTHESISARTIFDPITALAPSADSRTFAIGYLNGSILIATLQPSFTILHTLTTSRAPSRITGLAWHGSSSKQKTDMLATQTADGDLRVWSVPKAPHYDSPTIIRALGRSELPRAAPSWFSWSKNGRIVQFYDGETRSWDVRTKRVTYDLIPTIDGVMGIASYGPTATLFTLGRNHTAQQYDISPTAVPLQVQSVQHVPANTPPTPPTTLEERKNPYANSQASSNADAQSLPLPSDVESSADESSAMSPLQKIAREVESLDQLESELRDKITPLSPTSSRASSVSSKSSGGAHRQRKYLYDRPSSSRASTTTGYEGTEFSFTGEMPKPTPRDSMSIRSESTRASHAHYRSSSLRKEILRSPDEVKESTIMDLFPYTKSRLRDVALQTPHYGETARTPEILQREMLSVVFGWNDTVESMIREEMSRHRPGSASTVLLAKWLSDMGADSMASLVGSESMTSSDWMLLALSSIGQDSQKKVGEAFVQRLLEKGDIHPAVAILLGLGETQDAIEVYVSQGYFMEAILLTSLFTPANWSRQTNLLRKWGEVAIRSGEPELAVRIFSCASIETTVPWSSPGAQNAVFAAQHEQGVPEALSPNPLNSPPLSPPSRSGSGRLTAKNASLKLITTFGAKGAPINATADDPTPLALGLTPIITSAMSPTGWRPIDRGTRAPSSARTATPGGFGRRRRLPSKGDAARMPEMPTPVTAARDRSTSAAITAGSRNRRTPSVSDSEEPTTALRPFRYDDSETSDANRSNTRLPSPSRGAFARSRTQSRPRLMSRDRNPDGLKVQIVETRYTPDALSPGPSTQDTSATGQSGRTGMSRARAPSPAMTNASMKSAKTKAIDDYINSVEEARLLKRNGRPESRTRSDSRMRSDVPRRTESRTGRAPSKARDCSEARGRSEVHYIRPSKRSPSSPVPMSPEEIAQANAREAAAGEPEHFYKSTNVQDTHGNREIDESDINITMKIDTLPNIAFGELGNSLDPAQIQTDNSRGRSNSRGLGSSTRSPSSPLPSIRGQQATDEQHETQSDGRRVRTRAQSSAQQDLQTRRAASRSRPSGRSESCVSNLQRTALLTSASQLPDSSATTPVSEGPRRARTMTRKELAARELEERRLSLARRPSAPAIPLPNNSASFRPRMSPRSNTELGDNPRTMVPPISRSQTADPEVALRYGKFGGTSTPSAPIGLPATPRAMKHPQYMGHDLEDRDVPPVPVLPSHNSSLTGSMLSQTASSSLSQAAPSSLSQAGPSSPSQVLSSLVSSSVHDFAEDTIAPLLPSTVFGKQGPQAPPRAASAPIEKSMGQTVHHAYKQTLPSSASRRLSGGRGHVRKISPPENQNTEAAQPGVTSIDEAIHGISDQQVIIVDTGTEEAPIMLPELQHLAMPPPPPPPALYQYAQQDSPDDGDLVIDVNVSTTGTANSGTASDLSQAPTSFPQYPYHMERAATASPQTHRRGHGSISESFGSRMRGVADRMRNGSRSRAKSPPMLEALTYDSPYETVLPPFNAGHLRRDSVSRAKSPYEQAMAEQQNAMPPPPPPPPAPPAPGNEGRLAETSVPPRSQSATSGYRHPKAVRANMPPDHIQAGAGPTGFL